MFVSSPLWDLTPLFFRDSNVALSALRAGIYDPVLSGERSETEREKAALTNLAGFKRGHLCYSNLNHSFYAFQTLLSYLDLSSFWKEMCLFAFASVCPPCVVFLWCDCIMAELSVSESGLFSSVSCHHLGNLTPAPLTPWRLSRV